MISSKQTRRIAGLDVLRTLAILLVLIAHYPKPEGGTFMRMLNFGWTGVDLFFVLSGYLIGGQLFAGLASGMTMTPGNFYGRRLLRTLPNYYVVLSIYLIVSAPVPAWRFFIFTQNLGIPSGFTPSWSLCVEEHFYLAFPLVVMVLARIRSPNLVAFVFGVILLFGIGVRAAIWTTWRPDQMSAADALATYLGRIYFPTYCRLDGITLGVALAALKSFRPETWQRLMTNPKWLLGGSGVFLIASVLVFWTRYTFVCSTIGFTMISISFALLTAGVLSDRSMVERYTIPGTHLVAKLSYGIYLTHSLAIDCAARIVSLQSPAGVVVTGTLVLVFTGTLYWLVERPCLLLRDRLFRRDRSPASPAHVNSWSARTALACVEAGHRGEG
jgi:peptidoglycan/LPS O-acetylase OafA/YrhL